MDVTEPKINARIGANIRKVRSDQALSQKELAARVGCSVSAISQTELGNAAASVALICRIARELNVTPAKLLEGADTYHRDAVQEDIWS